jgi:hypothetical protein
VDRLSRPELGSDDGNVTLAGRLYRLQQLTEVAHQLAQLEEAHREDAGQ